MFLVRPRRYFSNDTLLALKAPICYLLIAICLHEV